MNRCLALAAGMAVCVTSLVTTAHAIPPIMDRVPADAPVVMVIPSIEGLEKDINSVLQLAGAGQLPMTADDLLGMAGLTGVSKKGSIAMVMLKAPDLEAGGPPSMVAIFQADDYAALTKGLNSTKDGELDKATLNDQDVWMKNIGGGFVVAGPEKEDVTKFEGKSGSADGHKKFYGSKADKVTDKADFAIFVNVAKLKPLIDQGAATMEQMLAGSPMGEDPTEQIKWMKDHIAADMDGAVVALSIDSAGVSLDMLGAAKEGSKLATALSTAGKAHALLSKVPGGAYLAAYAIDTSNKQWQDFFKTMPASPTPGMEGLEALMAGNAKGFEDTTGMAVVVGVPAGGLANGLLSRITGYVETKTPDKVIALARDEMPKALEQDDLGKMVYKTAVTEVDGVKVDSYELTLNTGEDVPPMVMGGMFGGSGAPSGYVAVVDGGVVAITSKSSELMGTALKAVKGEATLGSDKTLAAVHEKLPAGCYAEGYLNVREVIDMLLKLAPTMGGPTLDVKLPAKLPPVAGGMGMGDRQAHLMYYIPAEVIKTGGDVYKAAMKAMEGEGEEEGEPQDDGMAPKGDKGEKGPAPKF
jgi:hypothetical protein